MHQDNTLLHRVWRKLGMCFFYVCCLLAVQMAAPMSAFAGGGGGTSVSGAIQPAQDIANEVALALSGSFGIVLGTLAFAIVGLYIMFARSTGQAVGAVAKVIIGLVILFGGAAMVTSIQGTGAVI